MYCVVRELGTDASEAHTHPQSPLDEQQKAAFQGLRYFDYDPAFRVAARVDTDVETMRYELDLEAFAETDGYDPEWAAWYAAVCGEPAAPYHGRGLGESELAGLFEYLSKKQPYEAPGAPWARFYAEFIVQSLR
jgi:hypothetical protein